MPSIVKDVLALWIKNPTHNIHPFDLQVLTEWFGEVYVEEI